MPPVSTRPVPAHAGARGPVRTSPDPTGPAVAGMLTAHARFWKMADRAESRRRAQVILISITNPPPEPKPKPAPPPGPLRQWVIDRYGPGPYPQDVSPDPVPLSVFDVPRPAPRPAGRPDRLAAEVRELRAENARLRRAFARFRGEVVAELRQHAAAIAAAEARKAVRA